MRGAPETLAGRQVIVYSDNQSAVRILETGSTRPELQRIARRIFDLALRHSIDEAEGELQKSQGSEALEVIAAPLRGGGGTKGVGWGIHNRYRLVEPSKQSRSMCQPIVAPLWCQVSRWLLVAEEALSLRL